MAVVGSGGRNPCVLIRQQGYPVHGNAVTDGVQRQGLRTVQLLMSVDVLHGQILEEAVVGIHHHSGSHADVLSILTTRHAVVFDDGHVTVLTNQVHVRLCLGNVHVFLVLSVLDEDEPRLGTSLGSCIDGCLHTRIVARSICGNHSVV